MKFGPRAFATSSISDGTQDGRENGEIKQEIKQEISAVRSDTWENGWNCRYWYCRENSPRKRNIAGIVGSREELKGEVRGQTGIRRKPIQGKGMGARNQRKNTHY